MPIHDTTYHSSLHTKMPVQNSAVSE